MRKPLALIISLLITVAIAAPAQAAPPRPSTYIVSTTPGTLPEGISVTGDGTMYVTSFGTGAVHQGNLHDSKLHPFIPAGADGRGQAAGVHVDRWGRIFVAGFDTGALYVYDRAGHLLAKRTTVVGAGLNDFTFAGDAVYVTDSVNQIIWRASLTPTGIGRLTAWLTPDRLSPAPGYLNGIVATPDGALLVADQVANVTYHVDIASRAAVAISVTGADGLFSADGLLLEGHRLYGVYNYADPSTPSGAVWVTRAVLMNRDYTKATWIADSAAAPDQDTPTTLARDGDRLLWVNSQLLYSPGTPPYTVSAVPGLR